MINCCSCRGGEVGIKAWIYKPILGEIRLQYLYQQWVIGMRAKNNKKAVLSVLTKTFFSSMRKKNRVDKQIHVVRTASRGVLRLSPGLIKLREESTHAGHRCMSSGDQQSFIRGGSAQRSKPLFTIFDKKGTLPFYLLLPTNGTRFTYVAKRG